MDQRKEPRLDVEFQVHVWGVDRLSRPFAEMVRARNVSNKGAVLLGMRSKIRAGDLVDVQHSGRRAQFRIMWTRTDEIGIQALPFEPCIWGGSLPKTFEMAGTG